MSQGSASCTAPPTYQLAWHTHQSNLWQKAALIQRLSHPSGICDFAINLAVYDVNWEPQLIAQEHAEFLEH